MKSFEDWMSEVDQAVSERLGVSVHDLPDVCFRDLYDDGFSPLEAAGQAICNAQE